MSSNALFAPSNSRNQQKHLVEFKAGKMYMKGNMVHPDKKKGLLYVYQSEDALMHLCWKDRQSGNVEDDLIIFPDDCEFKRVPECTTGRVYLLKFKSNMRKFFFWVQEAKTDKDEENCRRINEVLNNPPSLNSSRNSGGTPDGELQSILNNMSQQQLMQLFGGVSGQMGGISNLLGTMNRPSSSSNRATSGSSSSSKPPTSTSSASSKSSTKTTTSQSASSGSSDKPQTPTGGTSSGSGTSSIQLSDLQNFLSGLGVPGNSESASVQPALTSDALQSILNNPEAVKELQKYLPSEGTDLNQEENLRSTLSCPQFQQALRTFSTALQSGQLGPVVQQFEVGSDAVQAANQGNMEEFVKALQNAKISSESSKQPEKRKTSEDSGTEAKKKGNKDDEKPNEEK
ncbi:proteasomal ubiquitin receptor ADRM1 homolog isoform X2 [Planococcus citri]|uniref:proteasomal ubiquitin receptor ADRM1 homolog isoform X2 n=1 Tax=Planococcus citri TaxID=170843 RepID=UPI0031F97BDD